MGSKRTSILSEVKHRLSEGARRFLGQIVTDTAANRAMFVLPGKLATVRIGCGVRRSVGVAFHRYGWNRNGRGLGELLLDRVISRLAISETHAPPIVVDNDCNVVGIVE